MHRPMSPPDGSGVSLHEPRLAPHSTHIIRSDEVDSLPSRNISWESLERMSCLTGGEPFTGSWLTPSNSRTVLQEIFTNQGHCSPDFFHSFNHLTVNGSPAFPLPNGTPSSENFSPIFFIASSRLHFDKTEAVLTSTYFSSALASTLTSAPALLRDFMYKCKLFPIP